MAHLRKIPSGKWQAEVRLPNGKRQTKTSTLKSVVAEWARELEREVDRGEWVDPAVPVTEGLTVGAWGEQFMATRVVKPETYRNNENVMRLRILPYFADTKLADIKPSMVRQWLAWMAESGAGAAIQRKAYNLARQCFDAAIADELVATNPFSAVKAPPVSIPPIHWFTHEQVVAIMDHLTEPYKTQVLLMAWCGLRWGECCGLRVQDVNMLRRRLVIQGQMTQMTKTWVEYAKTDTSLREVPVPAHVFGVLVGHLAGKAPGDLIFTTPRTGTPFNGSNWRRRFDKGVADANEAAEKLGPTGVRVPEYPPHALRHTAASWLLQAGVPLAEVGKLLGHSTPAMTARYAHLVPDYHEPVERGWDRILEGTADVRQMYGRGPGTLPTAETS